MQIFILFYFNYSLRLTVDLMNALYFMILHAWFDLCVHRASLQNVSNILIEIGFFEHFSLLFFFIKILNQNIVSRRADMSCQLVHCIVIMYLQKKLNSTVQFRERKKINENLQSMLHIKYISKKECAQPLQATYTPVIKYWNEHFFLFVNSHTIKKKNILEVI